MYGREIETLRRKGVGLAIRAMVRRSSQGKRLSHWIATAFRCRCFYRVMRVDGEHNQRLCGGD